MPFFCKQEALFSYFLASRWFFQSLRFVKAAEPSGKRPLDIPKGGACSTKWSQESRAASGRAERFGAKNEALFSYFLWRRERSKETSTLTKPSPIWEGCN